MFWSLPHCHFADTPRSAVRFGESLATLPHFPAGDLQRGLERFWLPCPNLCWRIVEKFGEVLATLPQFVREDCREVWRGFGYPASVCAGSLQRGSERFWQPCPISCCRPPPKSGSTVGWRQPGWQPRHTDVLAGGLKPSPFNPKKKHPITGTPRELGCCLPDFLLETCREVWGDFGSPAPVCAGDLQRGLERPWQPCPIACCRPPPPISEHGWMETARLKPRGNSVAACCCPPMCIPGVRLVPWC